MPITLSVLDNRKWDDLVAEGRSMIPQWAAEWTNHNPSDPGITLMELFAYFCEILIYRIDRISDANILAFLRLINGHDWRPSGDLAEDIRRTILDLRKRRRAVTADDYEYLALDANESLQHTDERVVRAKCVPRRNLLSEEAAERKKDAPAHVTVLIVTQKRTPPSDHLLRSVRHALEPGRILTTRVHVAAPRYAHVGVRATIVLRHWQDAERVRKAAFSALERFFDPLEGGLDDDGWPFGRSVFVSEIYEILDRVPGVDFVLRSDDPELGSDLDELTTPPDEAWRLRHNSDGRLEAVALDLGELVEFSAALSRLTMKGAGE
jgi:hypothetical protein